jgi:hypothetical protein
VAPAPWETGSGGRANQRDELSSLAFAQAGREATATKVILGDGPAFNAFVATTPVTASVIPALIDQYQAAAHYQGWEGTVQGYRGWPALVERTVVASGRGWVVVFDRIAAAFLPVPVELGQSWVVPDLDRVMPDWVSVAPTVLDGGTDGSPRQPPDDRLVIGLASSLAGGEVEVVTGPMRRSDQDYGFARDYAYTVRIPRQVWQRHFLPAGLVDTEGPRFASVLLPVDRRLDPDAAAARISANVGSDYLEVSVADGNGTSTIALLGARSRYLWPVTSTVVPDLQLVTDAEVVVVRSEGVDWHVTAFDTSTISYAGKSMVLPGRQPVVELDG